MDNAQLPLGILLFGIAGIAGFMAFRPWPTSTGGPIKPGAYAVEILQGKPPAASNPPDRNAEITVIEGGLAALLGLWAFSKISGALGGAPVVAGSGSGDTAAAGDSIGSEIESEATSVVDELPSAGA